jgi:methylthioribose-1-phosphate isomerase
VDALTSTGADVEIEDRGAAEVLSFGGSGVAPDGAAAANPAFDVTPHDLVTAIVTDRRVIRPDRGERP